MRVTHLEGGAELEAKLKRLAAAVAGDDLERSVLAGAEPILSDMVDRTPEHTGLLKSEIVAETLAKDALHVTVGIGAFGSKHAHLVEYGHQLVRGGPLGGGGHVVGQVPPHPFIRPAYDEHKDDAVTALGDELRTLLEREAHA